MLFDSWVASQLEAGDGGKSPGSKPLVATPQPPEVVATAPAPAPAAQRGIRIEKKSTGVQLGSLYHPTAKALERLARMEARSTPAAALKAILRHEFHCPVGDEDGVVPQRAKLRALQQYFQAVHVTREMNNVVRQ